MSFDLTNKNIQDTFQNLLQKTGSDGRLFDLEGKLDFFGNEFRIRAHHFLKLLGKLTKE